MKGYWVCSNCKVIQHEASEPCPKCHSVIRAFYPIQEYEPPGKAPVKSDE